MRRLLPELEAAKPSPGEDMLYGVDEIAEFLGLTRLGEKKAAQAVYQLRREGGVPIFKIEGAGLAARKSALLAYLERKEKEALQRPPRQRNRHR